MPRLTASPGIGHYSRMDRQRRCRVPRYFFRIWVDGRQYYKGGFQNKADAIRARNAVLTDLERDAVDLPLLKYKNLKFPELLEELATRKLLGKGKFRCEVQVDGKTKLKEFDGYYFLDVKAESERSKDASKINRLVKYFEKSKAQILPGAVLNYINQRRKEESAFGGTVSDRTIRLDVNALKKILDLAVAERLIMNNSLHLLNKSYIKWSSNQPKKREFSRKYLDSETVRRIVAEAVRHMMQNDERAFIIPIMAYTGNRPKQIVQLRLEDFRADEVSVRPAAEKSAYHRTGGGRSIILVRPLHRYLRWWAHRRGLIYEPAEGFLKSDGTQACGTLFSESIPSDAFTKLFKRIVKRIASKEPAVWGHIEKITGYSLRHTAATNFANGAFKAGVDLKHIADHLGCTVPTLLRVYLKALDCHAITEAVGNVILQSHMKKMPRPAASLVGRDAAMGRSA